MLGSDFLFDRLLDGKVWENLRRTDSDGETHAGLEQKPPPYGVRVRVRVGLLEAVDRVRVRLG